MVINVGNDDRNLLMMLTPKLMKLREAPESIMAFDPMGVFICLLQDKVAAVVS